MNSKTKIILTISVIAFISGCTHFIKIVEESPNSETISDTRATIPCTVRLKKIQNFQNNIELIPSIEFHNFILSKFVENKVFLKICNANDKDSDCPNERFQIESIVRMTLKQDYLHNGIMAGLLGGTLLLAAPLIKMKYTGECDLTFKIYDNASVYKEYNAKTKGILYYNDGPTDGMNELQMKIINKSMTSIINQMLQENLCK